MAKKQSTTPATKTPATVRVSFDIPLDVWDFFKQILAEKSITSDPCEEVRDMVLERISHFLTNLEYTPFGCSPKELDESFKSLFAGCTRKGQLRSLGLDRWPYTDRLKPKNMTHAKKLGERRRLDKLSKESQEEKRIRAQAVARRQARIGGAS
ncbi:MAG: hypothetical protein HZB26_07315 [Candidatus Hydrogenedentes bacterium]|nr:hypothetical protein [Candidatus Hydrogenedentota bacterium]